MPSLLSYWQLIAGAVAAFALSFLLHTVDVNRIEANQRETLAKQEDTLTRQCTTNIQKIERANDELQKAKADNAARAIEYKRLHPTKHILPRSGVAKLRPSGRGHAIENGEVVGSTDDFRDFAEECNDYRSDRISIDMVKADYNKQLQQRGMK